jgi:hypothetical protein
VRCLLATKLFNKHPLAILNGTSNPIGLDNEHSLFQRISIHLHYDVKASNNNTEHANTLRGQNSESQYVKAGGTYSNRLALKG